MTVDRGGGQARVVVADEGPRSGRGAYLCRRVSCLDRAIHRRAFQRAFRASVVLMEGDIAAVLAAAAAKEPPKGDGR